MSRPLEIYFEQELAFLQDQAEPFARRFPAETGGLLPRTDLNADPHLERIVEAFAVLAGRIHHKIESEFPELTEALLQILYPHLLRIVPSMTIAQMKLAGESCPKEGHEIGKETQLYSQPIGIPSLVCQYRTGYPVKLWPIRVVKASVEPGPFTFGIQGPPRSVAALRVELECLGNFNFSDLPLEKLRFYLHGPRHVVAILYELLFNHTQQVIFRSLDRDVKIRPLVLKPADCLTQVGFERDEGLLPYPCESFVGHRLLTEFLSFPEKFHFADLGGWQHIRAAGFRKKLEVILFLNRTHPNVEQGVNQQTFLLGCTPIINLFAKSAEPLALTHLETEYRVVPSRKREEGLEVFSVDSVVGVDQLGQMVREFLPFFTIPPEKALSEPQAFWYQRRKASPVEDDLGTDVFLTMVDQEFDPRLPAEMVLDIQTTCSNREIPGRFQRGGDPLYLDRQERGKVTIEVLFSPTAPLRPALRHGAHWRLLAQNCLNYVSLSLPSEGGEALQEMLRLCDFSKPGQQLASTIQQAIEGVAGLTSRKVTGYRTESRALGICQGMEFTLELDEKKYVGMGMFVFACVVERFLGYYAAINAFSQLIAKTKQGEGILKKWPPRSADRQIL
jgi:type VI secretion system protein ImpG